MKKDYLIYSLEDDLNISHIINLALTKNGYSVKSFYNYQDFITSFNDKKPNMILLDLMLPDKAGEEVLKEIRLDSNNDSIMIIVISAKNLTIDKIDNLDLGADDYIEKPFDILELMSRVNAHSRRYLKKKNQIIKLRNIEFNIDNHTVKVNNEIVKFTNSEYLIIEYLFSKIDLIVTREELYNVIWGKDSSYETRILDVHIKEIRKKLGQNNNDLIETIYGIGYRLKNE